MAIRSLLAKSAAAPRQMSLCSDPLCRFCGPISQCGSLLAGRLPSLASLVSGTTAQPLNDLLPLQKHRFNVRFPQSLAVMDERFL